MIICPSCHHEVLDGEIFCSICGAQLVGQERQPAQAVHKSDLPDEYTKPDVSPESVLIVGGGLALFILDEGQILPLTDSNEITIGRVSKGQTIVPKIDLSAYKAYEKGVSRMHISIKKIDQNYSVTDLGSLSGTQLNGKKILTGQSFQLENGDILCLGKLKIQILIRKQIGASHVY
jgi:pSer/pThr/pTyr-binding forkhead associated (FHA) protein